MRSALPLPSLEVQRLPDHTVVRVVGCDSLNEYNSDVVGEQLSALVEDEDRLRLVLDLDGIRYATSTALGHLIGLNNALRQSGGRLVLLNPGPAVAEALSVTRLDTILEIQPPLSDSTCSRGLSA